MIVLIDLETKTSHLCHISAMLRRHHPLRKSSRRCWALLAPSQSTDSQPSVFRLNSPCECQSSVAQFFASLSRGSLEDLILGLQTVTLESFRTGILIQFRDDVLAGHWGNRDAYLRIAIKLLKQSPTSVETRLVAETLATIAPSEDVRLNLLEEPEQLLWLEDLFIFLPSSLTFQYHTHILTALAHFKEAICTKSLSIGEFARIRCLS